MLTRLLCERERWIFQSCNGQIWTMAQGAAGAEALRKVRSPDGNLPWQVPEDYSRFSCQTVFMLLVKGRGNRKKPFSIWTLMTSARNPLIGNFTLDDSFREARFTNCQSQQKIENSGWQMWQVVISICLRILSQARVVWCQSATVCPHASFLVL